ncbi:MAG: hypothetical protein CVV49_15460 [Spirochaetae bacterium HGW-Spirochaetae-5]|nr:MAG: hypothetical protein CVV49_15460 [Spirochaetae bacterium HGW-Spirochaetae-5]
MGDLKLQVKSSFRTEMFAAGLYSALADQCRRENPELGARLKKISGEEQMHGKLFRQYYFNAYKDEPGSEKLWIIIGKSAGRLIRFIPLRKKLKSLSDKEAAAVLKIEAKLKCDDDPSYQKILKRILPDEVSHAAMFGEIFN